MTPRDLARVGPHRLFLLSLLVAACQAAPVPVAGPSGGEPADPPAVTDTGRFLLPSGAPELPAEPMKPVLPEPVADAPTGTPGPEPAPAPTSRRRGQRQPLDAREAALATRLSGKLLAIAATQFSLTRTQKGVAPLSGAVGVLANELGQIVSNNGGAILSNNGGAVLSNNGGRLISDRTGGYRLAQVLPTATDLSR